MIMGSGAEVVRETVAELNAAGEKVGVVAVRLLPAVLGRSISSRRCRKRARSIAVLDRTKEPGATGEPLYLDIVATLAEAVCQRHARHHAEGHRRALRPVLEGFRSGAGQGGVRRVEEAASRRTAFTVGINDDVTYSSLEVDPALCDRTRRCRARRVLRPRRGRHGRRQQEQRQDHRRGCRAATRRAISSTIPTSPARRPCRICASARNPIRAPYLIRSANFVACHQFHFLEKIDVLRLAAPGATFLLNSPYGPDEVWERAAARDADARSSPSS